MSLLKKEKQDLENAASRLLNLALKMGVDAAEVCATYSQQTKIALEKQDYHLASADDGYQFGLRVLVGQKQGFASSNSIEVDELKEVATQAVQIAKISPANPYYQIVASENIPKEAPGDSWDDALANVSLQTQKDWTKLMVGEALRDPRFRLNEGSLNLSQSLFLIMNSRGTHKFERETQASWTLMGMGVEGDMITSFDYFQALSRKALSVPEKMVQTTKHFRDRVLKGLKGGKADSYKGAVLLNPRAVSDILLSPIMFHLNGRNVVEGTSKWKWTDIGKKVFDANLTLTDLSWNVDRFGFGLFDREGTPTQERALIDQGTLKGFLLDHYAAKALGGTSTGNAGGGPSSLPVVSPHSLVLAGGETALPDLLKMATELRSDFLGVNRFSGQVDPITGDFSGVAKGADWWHAGEPIHCVKETLISGNIFESLGKDLLAQSRETEIVDNSEETPSILLDNISVVQG